MPAEVVFHEDILTDCTYAVAEKACQVNQADWFRLGGRLAGEVRDDPDMVWHRPANLYGASHVALADFAPDVADARVDQVLTAQRALRRPLKWWVGSASGPSDLGERLLARGLEFAIDFPIMAYDLGGLDQETPAHLEIRPIEDFAIFETHPHPMLSLAPAQTAVEVHQALCEWRPRRVWHFAASVDGVPLGASSLFLGAGVAGLYDIGVLERARRQGVGTAVTFAAMQFAKELGYKVAVLITGRMGALLYATMGFREIGSIGLFYRKGE